MKLQCIYIYIYEVFCFDFSVLQRSIRKSRARYILHIYIYIYMLVIIENIPSHKRKAEEVSTTPNTQCNNAI